MKQGHRYAVYLTFKQFALSAVFIYFALTLTPAINGHYNKAVCALCNDQATARKTVAYEFSACSSITPAASGANLMIPGWTTHVTSAVPYFLFYALLICAFALLLTLALWWHWQGQFDISTLAFSNTLLTVCWMIVSNGYMQLYLKDSCYISAWGLDFMLAHWIVQMVIVGPLVIEILFQAVCGCCGKPVPSAVQNIFGWLCLVGCLGMTVITTWLSVLNLQHTGNFTHLILAIVCNLSILDGLFLYWKWGDIPNEYVDIGSKVAAITWQQKRRTFRE
jgi:hypothetical protein